MKKKYLVLNEKEEHMYVLFVEQTDKAVEYTLFVSNNEIWSDGHKGKEVVKVVDEGDLEYKIRIGGEKIGGRLDASQIDELRLVLNFMDKIENDGKYFYKLFEDIDTNYILL